MGNMSKLGGRSFLLLACVRRVDTVTLTCYVSII